MARIVESVEVKQAFIKVFNTANKNTEHSEIKNKDDLLSVVSHINTSYFLANLNSMLLGDDDSLYEMIVTNKAKNVDNIAKEILSRLENLVSSDSEFGIIVSIVSDNETNDDYIAILGYINQFKGDKLTALDGNSKITTLAGEIIQKKDKSPTSVVYIRISDGKVLFHQHRKLVITNVLEYDVDNVILSDEAQIHMMIRLARSTAKKFDLNEIVIIEKTKSYLQKISENDGYINTNSLADSIFKDDEPKEDYKSNLKKYKIDSDNFDTHTIKKQSKTNKLITSEKTNIQYNVQDKDSITIEELPNGMIEVKILTGYVNLK